MTQVLVTGGAGFIGSHFIRLWLASHPDDRVVNLDLLTYAGSRERLADLEGSSRYRFVQGTIGDPAVVRQAMQGCEAVVHFAAETHVDRSITDAAPFLRTNIEGTDILLDAARAGGVARFLHVSTDEVYGPVLEGEVDERAPLSPRSPYAVSKAAGDLLAQSYWATYSLPVVVARPTNIYGPAQFVEKFIPLAIINSLEGLPVPIYGDGQQRRAWLYVQDACEAVRTILERGQLGEVYNIAGGTEQPNLETARAIAKLLGRPPESLQHVTDRPGHDRRYAMHDAKLRALGWRPATPFDQGLAQTVAWYRGQQDWWRPLAKRLREDPYHWLNRSARPGAGRPSRSAR
ncbi:MAG: dTDP-glucose 4,6-dehydratase [Candidatus Omnitrophica bacterium]|nr:dTDP-glucose 4,6-dehydratase [Candidatus Omnitrophota bacterium]